MKKKLTVLIFLLFLTSPLIIHYNGTEFQFQGKAHGKEYCEEDDECEEEGEEDGDEDSEHDEDDDEDEDHKDQDDEDEGAEDVNENNNLGKFVKIFPESPTACKTSATVVGTVGVSESNKVTTEAAKSANYSKGLTVFGINILATSEVFDENLIHAANITAELIDNNEDGKPDNSCVTSMLNKLSTYVGMYNLQEGNSVEINPDPLDEAGADKYSGLGAYETVDNYADGESHDASIEEIFHLITQQGFSNVYPKVFGESNSSTSSLAKAMDAARGGEQRCAEETCEWTYNNTTCPDNGSVESGKAWYFYSDSSADYATQMTEYIYWSVSSKFDMHDSAAGKALADNEWCPNTRAELSAQDPTIYNLIDNSTYSFPTVLPNASYSYYTYSTSDIQSF